MDGRTLATMTALRSNTDPDGSCLMLAYISLLAPYFIPQKLPLLPRTSCAPLVRIKLIYSPVFQTVEVVPLPAGRTPKGHAFRQEGTSTMV